MKRILFLTVIILFGFVTLFPQLCRHDEKIFSSLKALPEYDVICLLGARVYEGRILSPVLKQRCDALLSLCRGTSIKKTIIVSGCGSYEVDSIVQYLGERGVPEKGIVKDYNGYNTGSSIKYLLKGNFRMPLLVSQSFHLHRAIEMANDMGFYVMAMAAESVSPVSENIPSLKKYSIRIRRYYRSSLLLILHKVGLYDLIGKGLR